MTGRKKTKLFTFCLAERFLPFMALLSTYILILCTFAPDFSQRDARVIRAEIIPMNLIRVMPAEGKSYLYALPDV